MEVNGKVSIITGSAQGLGKAFAARLLEAGGKVCISDVNEDKGEATLSELRERFGKDRVCFVQCDVTKKEQFTNLFDKAEEFFQVSCVDLLANNAGINLNHGWRMCMEVNIMSVMLGTEIALERMRAAGKSGQIINTASMAGIGPGLSEKMLAYTVSKHGVVALTRTMGATTKGVAHKCICPSWADTEIVSGAQATAEEREGLNKSIKDFGGLMTPEYVAEGFYRLVTQCQTGSALAVMGHSPYILLPDTSIPTIMAFVLLAKLCVRIFGPSVVKTNHLVAMFAAIMFLALYLLTIFF